MPTKISCHTDWSRDLINEEINLDENRETIVDLADTVDDKVLFIEKIINSTKINHFQTLGS